jgi:hypothetical protein
MNITRVASLVSLCQRSLRLTERETKSLSWRLIRPPAKAKSRIAASRSFVACAGVIETATRYYATLTSRQHHHRPR